MVTKVTGTNPAVADTTLAASASTSTGDTETVTKFENGDGNSIVTRDEFDALARELDEYKRLAETTTDRAEGMEAELTELRRKDEERGDLSAKLDTIERTLAGSNFDSFATSAEVERIRTDLAALAERESTAQLAVNASGSAEFSESIPGYEGGLVKHILETYFSGDVRRFRAAADAEAKRRATSGE